MPRSLDVHAGVDSPAMTRLIEPGVPRDGAAARLEQPTGARGDDGPGTDARPAGDSSAADPSPILQRAVEEAVRLLDAEGGLIGLLDDDGRLRFAYESGMSESRVQRWRSSLENVGSDSAGLIAWAMATGLVRSTADYHADRSFRHSRTGNRVVAEAGIRSLIAAPLRDGDRCLGALAIYSPRPSAFGDHDVVLARALAEHAATAVANAELVDRLRRSQEELARRAAAPASLASIAAQLTALRDPSAILQQAVDEAARLLEADGALLDLLDPLTNTVRWAYDAGFRDESHRQILRNLEVRIGEGMFGRAIEGQAVVVTGDYLADDRFVHAPGPDTFAREVGLRSMVAAPLVGESGPLGVLGIFSARSDAFGEEEVALSRSLATQATIALTNARRMDELAGSQTELARRADAEQAMREIAARITAIRDPDEVLQRIVDEARRLLESDGAHLTLLSDERSHLVPVVAAGVDDDTRRWMLDLRFPLHGGINGLAATLGRPVKTDDYLVDPRVPHEPDDQYVAARLGIRGCAVAPLRAPAGEIIGTLAISFRTVRELDDESIARLQVLADQAAIAVSNARLDTLLRDSESRYRYLVENSPDIVWSVDAEGRFTFLSETVQRVTGWLPEDLLGGHFGGVVHPSSREVAEIDWTAQMSEGTSETRGRVNLLHRDGHPVPAEFVAVNRIEKGVFAGANGSVRDMSERDRLERELRESEERYRYLVKASPDIVWAVDDQGLITFMGDRLTELTGWTPDEVVGQHFRFLTTAESTPVTTEILERVRRDPSGVYPLRIPMPRKDDDPIPVEIWVTGSVHDERFVGAHGSIRDMRENERLETDLRRQAAELAAGDARAHLARELHDSVTQALFSMTLMTRSIEMLMGRDPEAALQRLATLRDLQRDALAEMRALIFELRPGGLEEEGLVPALRQHAAAVQGRIGLPVVVDADLEERLPSDVEDVLYRIAQEALHNVVKHARARTIRLTLGPAADGVRLVVVDDGTGFDAAAVPAGHLGLAGMKARAEAIGGQLTVESRPGKGTTIAVVVPRSQAAAS
jgi:PAS domain S-box-containing protein